MFAYLFTSMGVYVRLSVLCASEKNIENCHFVGSSCSEYSPYCCHSLMYNAKANCRCPPAFLRPVFVPNTWNVVSFYNHGLFLLFSTNGKSTAVTCLCFGGVTLVSSICCPGVTILFFFLTCFLCAPNTMRPPTVKQHLYNHSKKEWHLRSASFVLL